MSRNTESLTLSVVVPVYSGEAYLDELVSTLNELKRRWEELDLELMLAEAIFVLDEPKDGSKSLLESKTRSMPWVRLVELSRNYGQHSATVAGILYSSGDWVVTLDEDMQHHPDRIEALLSEASISSADVVYAHPTGAVHGKSYRDRMSRLVKSIIARLSGNPFVKSFNSFRLMRGDIARAASSICSRSTYFDVALTWFTTRIRTVEFDMSDVRFEQSGSSGYRFSTLVQHAKRLILTTEFKILEATVPLAAVAFVASVALTVWILYWRFVSDTAVAVPGWASLMVVVLGFGSLTVFFLGVLAELLHISMLQLQGKPTFFVVNRASDFVLSQVVGRFQRASHGTAD